MSDLVQYPYWAEVAFRELLLGVAEIPGPRDHLRIIDYFRTTGLDPFDGDETPWCSVGLNWCLRVAGIEGTGAPNARSFLTWGRPVDIRRGAIGVLWRVRPDAWQGHVGIVMGWTEAQVSLLAGNQGNTWSVEKFSKERLLDTRWPTLDQMYA